jgi:hypothetical protein
VLSGKCNAIALWRSTLANRIGEAVWKLVSTFALAQMSHIKAAFWKHRLGVFGRSLERNAFLRDSGCAQSCVLQSKKCLQKWKSKLAAVHVLLFCLATHACKSNLSRCVLGVCLRAAAYVFCDLAVAPHNRFRSRIPHQSRFKIAQRVLQTS